MSAVGDKNLLTKALSEREVKLRSAVFPAFRSGKECDKYPVVFFFTPPPNKSCKSKRFLPRKIEEKEFDSGDVVYHRTPFCSRAPSATGRDHPLRPPQARVGMISKCKRFHEKKEIKRPVSCQTAARQHLKDARHMMKPRCKYVTQRILIHRADNHDSDAQVNAEEGRDAQ
jgi:hypothetical protein